MCKTKQNFIVAVDFDGTIANNAFPDITKAELMPNIKLFLDNIKWHIEQKGLNPIFVLWTCRSNNKLGNFLDEAVQYCKNNEIHFDYINESPQHPMFKNIKVENPSPKIHADVYIDDKTLNFYEDYRFIDYLEEYIKNEK